ncbi:MAG: 5-bromo-4-chloroindolyl phosphate hydrolysis family protein [Eggerthellaceae bacterium]|nr:5-bromo-4-chloroindolyl phosphate hydrolysis family protein [Eggerthellaceae bacterium]
MSTQDFEKLCKTIDDVFEQIGKAAEKGIGRPSSRSIASEKRFASSTGLTVGGVVMTVLGAMGILALGAVELIGLVVGLFFNAGSIAAGALFGALLIGFAVLLGFGIRNLVTASRLRTFRRVFGTSEALSFHDLAMRMRITPAKAASQARALLKRGLIPYGCIDDENTTLMVTQNAYQQYCQFRNFQRMQLEQQRIAEEACNAQEAAARNRQQSLERLTPAERAFVEKGRGYQAQLLELDRRIDDAEVSERIASINEVVGRVLSRAEEQPALIARLDRLTTYYLPTTVKLLDAYDSLEDQPVQGDNISSSRKEIEKTLEVLKSAFEKLLDDTYREMSLDVSTDISVLHSVLAREGLLESPFALKP